MATLGSSWSSKKEKLATPLEATPFGNGMEINRAAFLLNPNAYLQPTVANTTGSKDSYVTTALEGVSPELLSNVMSAVNSIGISGNKAIDQSAKDQEEMLKMRLGMQPQEDISPLLNFIDSKTGSKLAAGYQRPETPEATLDNAIATKQKIASQYNKISATDLAMLKTVLGMSDKKQTTNLLTSENKVTTGEEKKGKSPIDEQEKRAWDISKEATSALSKAVKISSDLTGPISGVLSTMSKSIDSGAIDKAALQGQITLIATAIQQAKGALSDRDTAMAEPLSTLGNSINSLTGFLSGDPKFDLSIPANKVYVKTVMGSIDNALKALQSVPSFLKQAYATRHKQFAPDVSMQYLNDIGGAYDATEGARARGMSNKVKVGTEKLDSGSVSRDVTNKILEKYRGE